MSFSTDDRLLTVYEVSDILKLSVLTIYKYIRTNQLEAVEFGGHYRVSSSALSAFIENHKVSSGKETK